MSLISAFLAQSAEIRPFIREGAAEPLYGQIEARKCRLQRGRHLVQTSGANGTADQVVANAKMFCEGLPIPERSIVTVDGIEYVVISCEIKNGFSDHHLEVYLQ